MAGMTAAVIGSAVIGGAMQADAARSAANAQRGAARDANALQWQMFQQQREDQDPWRQAGARALLGLENKDFQRDFSANDFQADPGFQFRMNEGMKAINASAAARGLGNSGSTLKALTKYGQDFASNEYQNAYNRFNNDRTQRFNRLSALAGIGQTANTQLGQAGMNYANQAGQNIMGAGNAASAGIIGGANAANQALGTGVNALNQHYMMNRMFPQTTAQLGGGMAGQSWQDFSGLA